MHDLYLASDFISRGWVEYPTEIEGDKHWKDGTESDEGSLPKKVEGDDKAWVKVFRDEKEHGKKVHSQRKQLRIHHQLMPRAYLKADIE